MVQLIAVVIFAVLGAFVIGYHAGRQAAIRDLLFKKKDRGRSPSAG